MTDDQVTSFVTAAQGGPAGTLGAGNARHLRDDGLDSSMSVGGWCREDLLPVEVEAFETGTGTSAEAEESPDDAWSVTWWEASPSSLHRSPVPCRPSRRSRVRRVTPAAAPALQTLSARHRAALALRYLEDWTDDDIVERSCAALQAPGALETDGTTAGSGAAERGARADDTPREAAPAPRSTGSVAPAPRTEQPSPHKSHYYST